MSLLVTLAFILPAMAADPLLDVGLTGITGAAGGVAEPMDLDIPLLVGGAVMGWVTPAIGVGLSAHGGTYGAISDDLPNLFAFVDAQYRFSPDWSAGLGIGTPVIWDEHQCFTAPCSSGLWEEHHPILSANATRDFEIGALHLPISLRGELSQPRWALGLELGVGLRLHRKA